MKDRSIPWTFTDPSFSSFLNALLFRSLKGTEQYNYFHFRVENLRCKESHNLSNKFNLSHCLFRVNVRECYTCTPGRWPCSQYINVLSGGRKHVSASCFSRRFMCCCSKGFFDPQNIPVIVFFISILFFKIGMPSQ